MKIDITMSAKTELQKVLESKNTEKPLRIYIAAYGWGGPSFGLALDEPKDDDEQLVVDEFNFVIENGLSDNYEKFTVDYSDNWLRRGFNVTPDRSDEGCS